MKIVHMSDIHGHFGSLIDCIPECDLIIDTGDFLPNNRRGPEDIGFQKDWIFKKRGGIQRLIKKARLGVVSVPGNHCWANVADFCDGWKTLNHELVTIEGLTIYGLPGVPFFGGEWNHEEGPETMSHNANKAFAQPMDILACHCPPWGVLDWTGTEHIGNKALTMALSHEIEMYMPKYVLCGHVHEQGGKSAQYNGTTVINSACGINMIEKVLT
jgi:Icc-related predicted phosphoesterase